MKYSKQEFEEAIYSLVAANIQAFFNDVLTGDMTTFHQNTIRLIREFMDVMHIATSEGIAHVFYSMKLFYEAANKEKH